MWVIRLLLLVLILYIIYRIILYFFHPKRKLELAHKQKKYYFYDDAKNVRKNFLLTYKGVMFEGEKYSSSSTESFHIISISIAPKGVNHLNGFVQEDFHSIEQKIYKHYPSAKIDWKSPGKEFLHSSK